jgi:hypothetical protein
MRVKEVEPMINSYSGSADYGKPFGVVLIYADGRCKRYSDLGLALCADLTRKQREYIKNLQREIAVWMNDSIRPC